MTHEEQQLPVINDNPFIHDLVSADIQSRKELGTERYGTPLQAENGRDALRDGYEEALDMAVYLRQAIEEREQGNPMIPASSAAWKALMAAPLGGEPRFDEIAAALDGYDTTVLEYIAETAAIIRRVAIDVRRQTVYRQVAKSRSAH